MQISAPTAPPVPVLPPREEKQLRVGQLNAYNFFDTVDHPSTQDPVPTPKEYRDHVSKLAHAIRDAMGAPDIITMQEVENAKVLKDLIKHPSIADLGYQQILREGTDPRGIDNAILYRDSTVTLQKLLQIDPVGVTKTGRTSRQFTRPPLLATFGINSRQDAARGVRNVSVISGHFTSKLGGEEAEIKRAEQAETVANFAHGLQAVDDRSAVIVSGDFNMERSEPSFKALRPSVRGAALVDVTTKIPKDERFTWRKGSKHFQLDHVLVSKNLAKHTEDVTMPRLATTTFKDATLDPIRAEGVSDHDPIVTTFDFES